MQRQSNKLMNRKMQIEIENSFAKANELQKQGFTDQAKSLYVEIIKKAPDIALIWDRLGYLYLVEGKLKESILHSSRAHEINPNSQPVIFNIALAYSKLGELNKAINYLKKLNLESSADADVLTLAGEIYFRMEDYSSAEKSFRLAVEKEPHKVTNYINWSMSLNALSCYEQSLDVCNVALMYEPDNAMLYFNKAIPLKHMGEYMDALACYSIVLNKIPSYSPAHNNMGNIYLKLKMYEKAIEHYEACLSMQSDSPEVWGNLGDAYFYSKEFNQSIECYSKAIILKRKDIRVLVNYANALQTVHSWDKALKLYDEALLLDPNNPEILCSKGNAFKGLKLWSRAKECFSRAKGINPEFSQADWNLALLELTLGNFELGYQLYEARWTNPELKLVRKNYIQPLWLGQECIKGAHLFIWDEQGLGDKIQMMRYARMLSEQGVHVTIEVPSSLVAVAKSLSPLVSVVSTGFAPENFDFHCPFMSLPLACKTTLQSIPSYPSYLSASSEKISEWQQRIDQKNIENIKNIGLAWSGSSAHANDHMRSISLERMLSNLDDSSNLYWSLQIEYKPEDLRYIKSSHGKIIDSSHLLHDFSDTAALIHHMDHVISVDTSVAHLAAAMGKNVTLLLPDDPDYRWLDGRADSPWYKSVKTQKIR